MELKRYKLRDLLIIKNGCEHKALKEGKYPVFGSGGIMRYVDHYLYDKPSILLPRKGSISNIQYCDTPFWTVDTLYYTIVDEQIANPYYLYRYLSLLDLSAIVTGTGLPSMTFDSYYNIDVELPDLDTQRRIASVLSNLDRKIALNRQINTNLEALARQLYDYWFVQFDFPDANGKPYKSSGGEMVYNEKLKREIPEGWTSTSLSNILDVLKDGTHNPPQRCAEGVPLLTGTMFGDLFLDYTKATYISFEDYNEIHKKYQPQENDIIITKIGTIGNINLLRKSDIPIAIHCNSALLRFKKMYNGPYALLFCKSKLFYSRLYATKGQSIQEFVSLDKIANVPVECPSQEVLEAFNNMLKPIICKLEKNQEEITSLTRQRDELLPLLMNGQITIQ